MTVSNPTSRIVVLFSLIAIAALGLRLYRIAEIPNGLHIDEASIGYNATCILDTGRDEHGTRWPLYFKAFGEYKNPVFIYTCVPVIACFGANEFSIRLTAALFGALTVFATGLLGSTVLGRWGGVMAAILLAVSPWHFQFSRIAFEAISLPLFITLAAWLLTNSDRKPRLAVAAMAPLAIATYCYAVARLFVPLFLVGFVLLRWRWLMRHRRDALFAFAVLFVLVLPNIVVTLEGEVQTRFNHLSVFSNGTARERGRVLLQSSAIGRHTPDWLRGSDSAAVGAVFVDNYLRHFSFDFLVRSGDPNPRHNPGGGMLSHTEFVFAVIGVAAFITHRRRWPGALVLWWLVIAPIPASLTTTGLPHAVRTLVALPTPQLLAAAGICFTASAETRLWHRLRRSSRGGGHSDAIPWRRFLGAPIVTAALVGSLFLVDVQRRMTWYFSEFPKTTWEAFFWKETAVARAMARYPEVPRFYIGTRSQRLVDVTLLFILEIPPEEWLDGGTIARVARSHPPVSELLAGDAVVCRPGDPRYRTVPLIERIVDPDGQPSDDLRGVLEHAHTREQTDHSECSQ